MGRGQIALRKGRHSVHGQVYFITFTTAGRTRLFDSWEVASEASRSITGSALWERSKLLSWVLMPDHWHGLIELGDDMSLSQCIRQLKGSSSRAIRKAYPQVEAIWAPGFYDHALRADAGVMATARYVILNPVRAGIVTRVGDYPYWDSMWI